MRATRPHRPPRHPAATAMLAAPGELQARLAASHAATAAAGGGDGPVAASSHHSSPGDHAAHTAALSFLAHNNSVGDYLMAGSYFYTPRIITRSGGGGRLTSSLLQDADPGRRC